jgi:hypothetical protein
MAEKTAVKWRVVKGMVLKERDVRGLCRGLVG